MDDVSQYRTPEEDADQAAAANRIAAVLDQARTNATSTMVAIHLGEPADVVEQWIDRTWNGLRDQLDGEDRLQAIMLLLEPESHREADRLLNGVVA